MKYAILLFSFLLCSVSFAATAVPFTTDLYQDMPRTQEVYRLSIVLKKEGFYDGELTSRYNAEMTKAVSRFQAKKKISPINGIVGIKTRYELNKIVLSWMKPSTPAPEVKKPVKPSVPVKEVVPVKKPEPKPVVVPAKPVPVAPVSKGPCEYKDKSYKDGARVRMFLYKVAPINGKCVGRWRTCVNGEFDGDLSYRQLSCTVPTVTSNGDVQEKTETTVTKPKQGTDDEDTNTNVVTKPKPNPKPDPEKPKDGCLSGGAKYAVGGTVQGCIGPGRTDPTAAQCLAALMPTYKCETYGWKCVDKCQFNYY
jgi:hypothetical protein